MILEPLTHFELWETQEMVSKTWIAMLVAAGAVSMTVSAAEQVPRSAPPLDTFAMFPTQDPMRIRTMTIMQLGLSSIEMDLSPAQKGEISKLVDAYAQTQIALNKNLPIEKGANANQAPIEARKAAVDDLKAALGKVMTLEQRGRWESDLNARRSAQELALRPHPQAGGH